MQSNQVGGFLTKYGIFINSTLKSHEGAVFYTLSSVAKSFAQLLSGFLVARFIIPGDLGLWNSLSLATTYGVFLQAGVINGLSRDLPFHLGAEEKEKAEQLAGTAQTYTALGCLCVLLFGGIFLLTHRARDSTLLLSIIAVTLVTAFTFYQNYLMVTFRSKNSFGNLAKTQFWTALIMVVSVPALYFWQYEGMVLRVVFITGFGVFLLHAIRPMKIELLWNWEAFRVLMKVGLPIFILSYIESTAGTFDKVILLTVGGVEQVGYYSFAMLVWGAFAVIPASLTSYLYPRMTYSFGRDRNPLLLWHAAWKWTIAVISIMLPLAITGWILIPLVVPILFPKYTAGIGAAQVLLFGALFYGAAIGVNALWSMKVWKYMVTYQLASALLRVAGPLAGVKLSASPLLGVSFGMLAAFAINFGLGLGLTYVATHQSSLKATNSAF
jgi:O-antigen/teichoic acid export membrane protein